MQFTNEEIDYIRENMFDSGWRITFDDALQLVTAKDKDGFHPSHSYTYKKIKNLMKKGL